MVVGDILKKISDGLVTKSYGRGVYKISYPAYFHDATPITVMVKLEADTEVVLERDEEVENMALLSTSDEYTIFDNGETYERFSMVEGIGDIMELACSRHHIKLSNNELSLEADTETTLNKLNRFVKCIFEIESKVVDRVGHIIEKEDEHNDSASDKLKEYLKFRGN